MRFLKTLNLKCKRGSCERGKHTIYCLLLLPKIPFMFLAFRGFYQGEIFIGITNALLKAIGRYQHELVLLS